MSNIELVGVLVTGFGIVIIVLITEARDTILEELRKVKDEQKRK